MPQLAACGLRPQPPPQLPPRRACAAAVALALAACCAPAAHGAVPVNAPRVPLFTDRDLDRGEIGGYVEFAKAYFEDDITYYALYFADSPTDPLSLLANLPVGATTKINLGMNFPLPTGATYFIVYSANADGIAWSLGVSCVLHDKAVPTVSPSGVAFTDVDYGIGTIGGRVTIARATDESTLTHYALYFGSSPSFLLQMLPGGIIPKATSPLVLTIANGTYLPLGATYILAYSWNADGNGYTPVSTTLHDTVLPVNPATSLAFVDQDMGVAEVSGTVTIGAATDETVITFYAVYFAKGATGPIDSLIDLAAKIGGTVTVTIPPDTPIPPGVTYLLVKTRSVDGEMATGISIVIVDRRIPIHPASSLSFLDTDIDRDQLGGIVTFGKALDESDITYYSLWFGGAAYAKIGGQITSLVKGPAQFTHTFPLDTPLPTGTLYLMVLAGNIDGVSTPANGKTITLVDTAVPLHPPERVSFHDADSDPGQISGVVTVQRALDESDINSYSCYYGTSATAVASSKYSTTPVGMVLSSGLLTGYATFPIGANTILPGVVTHFLVFSRNNDGEIRTGLSVAIVDRTDAFPTSMVSGLHFVDIDVNLNTIGGPLIWYQPASTAGLTTYAIYKALDTSGTLRILLATVAVGTTLFAIPDGTSLLAPSNMKYDYLLVYTQNTYGQALIGASLLIVDRALPTSWVLGLTFLDQDSRIGFLGGTVHWTLPSNPATPVQFSSLVVVLADFDGVPPASPATPPATLHVLGEVAGIFTSFVIPNGTAVSNFTHIQVIAKNSVGQSLRGSIYQFIDMYLPASAVLNVHFWDQDLGLDEIGGEVQWQEPPDTYMIQTYRVYLAASLSESNAFWVFVSEVPVGSHAAPIPFNTRIDNVTEIIVIAANSVGESLVFANETIGDHTPASCPAQWGHSNYSPLWRIVAGEVDSQWRLHAVRFFSDPACAQRIEAVPRGWPRRPRQLQGRPFSNPEAPKGLYEIFSEQVQHATWENGSELATPAGVYPQGPRWTSGTPCPDTQNASAGGALDFAFDHAACFVGFAWEANTYVKDGRVVGSTELLLSVGKRVHCVEVVQSTTPGEFAAYIALQWFSSDFNRYRTLMQQRVTTGGLTRMAYQQVLAAECAQVMR